MVGRAADPPHQPGPGGGGRDQLVEHRAGRLVGRRPGRPARVADCVGDHAPRPPPAPRARPSPRAAPRPRRRPSRGSPRPAPHARGLRGRAALEGQRDQHGPLALAQVVAGGLAGHRRVAEHAEHVVAQLERLAERQPVAVVRRRAARARRRRARRRAAAAARPCTSRSCSGSTCSARSTGRRRLRLLEHVEVLPAHQLGAHPVVDGAGRAAGPRPAARSRRTSRRTTTGTGRRAGSRRPRRRPPGTPSQPSPRCRAANRRCTAGWPRRVSLPSITSSWISAPAWNSSSEAATATISARRRRRRRRASPSSRTPAAAACRRASRSASASISGAQVVADVVEHRGLAGQDVVDGLVDPAAQVLRVERVRTEPVSRRPSVGACPSRRPAGGYGRARLARTWAMTTAPSRDPWSRASVMPGARPRPSPSCSTRAGTRSPSSSSRPRPRRASGRSGRRSASSRRCARPSSR